MKKRSDEPDRTPDAPSPTSTQYISTLQAARMLGVSTFSIQRWFDQGLLKGARLPGGRRKIEAGSLKSFMEAHGLLPAAQPQGDRPRVLIIDDDARLLTVIQEYLKQHTTCLIRIASTGLDAGLALAEFKPSAVVIDLMLGDMGGEAIVRRIRQSAEGRLTRIVAISGKASPAQIHDVQHAGANMFLAKPFEMRELAKALKLPVS